MNSPVEYSIKPAELLDAVGWTFRRRSAWLDVKTCPFCGGGDHRDQHTFAVHSIDGNYVCQRAGCGARGSFWKLLETAGRNPRDYVIKSEKAKPKRKKKKRFVYGR